MTELYLDSKLQEETRYYESLDDHMKSLGDQAWQYLSQKYAQYLDEDGDLECGDLYLTSDSLWLLLSDTLGDRDTHGTDTDEDWESYGGSDLARDYHALYDQALQLLKDYREYTRQYDPDAYYDRYGHYLRDPHWEYYRACWEDYGSYWPS